MSSLINRFETVEKDQSDLKNRLNNLLKRVESLEISKGGAGAGAQEASSGEQKAKSATQLKKEAKKSDKNEKFLAKQAKKAATAPAAAKTEEEKEKEAKKAKPAKVEEVTAYTSNTKPGEKKDTQCPLPSAYSPVYVEAAWYEWWEKMGFFKPECAVRLHLSKFDNPQAFIESN